MKTVGLMSLCILIAAGWALAGPAFLITEPPVSPPAAGPPFDPAPADGQWFKDRVMDEFEVRKWEFYDNTPLAGGGIAGTLAIEGYASGIVYAGASIVAFDIDATITNDLGTSTPLAAPSGTNSHGETVPPPVFCNFDMPDVKLTAEFAIDADAFAAWGGAMVPPYTDTVPHIVGEDHNQLGWYSFPDTGEFLVPTWDVGSIPLGGSVSFTMSFSVDGAGLDPADPRYDAIVTSEASSVDILLNRSTSLKISDWIEALALDPGMMPVIPGDPPVHGSDVSVFFMIPEPASILLVLGGLVGLLRQRR